MQVTETPKIKCFVFDFDNTIGYFTQIVFIINILEQIYKKDTIDYGLLFDTFPLVFRPRIVELLYFLFQEKLNALLGYNKGEKSNCNCHAILIVIYTKNTKPHFVERVISYLERKVKGTIHGECSNEIKLFDAIFFEKKKKTITGLNNTIYSLFEQKGLLNDCINEPKVILIIVDDNKMAFGENKELSVRKPIYYQIKCESYKYYYDNHKIIQLFPFHYFKKLQCDKLQSYLHILRKKIKESEKHKSLPILVFDLSTRRIQNIIQNILENS